MPLLTCPDCQSQVSDAAPACPKCGRPIYNARKVDDLSGEIRNASHRQIEYESRKKSGLVAAILNIVIPGAGYMYCGNVILGLFAMAVCLAILICTAGLAYFIIGPVMIIDGVLSAGRANRLLAKRLGAG
ncbi:MAG TPA: hypothetical protein VL357_05845 [Rariglobus sp.]|jgi:hypothetical protein|nr:hypothetical protein [Rariglobus sp.]